MASHASQCLLIFKKMVACFLQKLNELIKMNWRKQSWPIDHMSTVTLEFAPCAVGTRLTLNQCNVPSADKDSTTSGWPTYYFTAIRQTFGYGGSPFWLGFFEQSKKLKFMPDAKPFKMCVISDDNASAICSVLCFCNILIPCQTYASLFLFEYC